MLHLERLFCSSGLSISNTHTSNSANSSSREKVRAVLVKGTASRSNTIGLANDICMPGRQLREHIIEVGHVLLIKRDDLEEVSTLRS